MGEIDFFYISFKDRTYSKQQSTAFLTSSPSFPRKSGFFRVVNIDGLLVDFFYVIGLDQFHIESPKEGIAIIGFFKKFLGFFFVSGLVLFGSDFHEAH